MQSFCSLKADQDPELAPESSSSPSLKEEASPEKIKQVVEEAALQVQDKDVPKTKEGEGIKKKKKEDEEGALTETKSPQTVGDAEIQEVTGKEEQPSGSANVKLKAGPADEEEGCLRSRSVKIIVCIC